MLLKLDQRRAICEQVINFNVSTNTPMKVKDNIKSKNLPNVYQCKIASSKSQRNGPSLLFFKFNWGRY